MLDLFVIVNHDRRREHHKLVVFLQYTLVSEYLTAVVRREHLSHMGHRAAEAARKLFLRRWDLVPKQAVRGALARIVER